MTLPVIGIVGGIGSGKSLVAAEFANLGGHLIVADQLGHEALEQPDIKPRIVTRWGRDILDVDGTVSRRRLGRKVFADATERAALEEMVFPYIDRRILEEIEHASARPEVRFVVLDAAIMLEAGWSRRCDRIVFVEANRQVRLQRLRDGRGWREEELARRENAQLPLEQKRRHAEAVVVNEAGRDEIARQVRELLAAWGYANRSFSPGATNGGGQDTAPCAVHPGSAHRG